MEIISVLTQLSIVSGLHHLGVIKCLHSARLLPRIISGASSGSIMAAMVCTRTDDEIPGMFDPTGIKLVRLISNERVIRSPVLICITGCL